MAQIKLKKLLQKNKSLDNIIADLATMLPVSLAVQDVDGTLLSGRQMAGDLERTAIKLEEEVLGWVCGERAQAGLLAQLLGVLLADEAEKRALAAEMLDTYRELNLLYTLSERLLVEPSPEAIARLALVEANRLIQMTAGWVILRDGDRTVSLSSAGCQLALKPHPDPSDDLVARVLKTREAEICNGVLAHRYFVESSFTRCALLCAPLKTEQRILGVLLLAAADPANYSAHDLKLLNTVALQLAPALEMARLYQVAVDKGRMERELQMAYQVQAGLIPAETPEVAGWEFAGRWRPARELSGDYYDFIKEPDGRLGLVIGDVADKGMPSALFMVHTRAAVRTAIRYAKTPAEAIFEANQLVEQESRNGQFVTLLYSRLDTSSGELTFVNAGHNPALVYDAAGERLIELARTGLPLGIMAGGRYRQETVTLKAGDILIMYTDGITEAVNTGVEEFGRRRLETIIREHAAAPAEAIADAIQSALDDFVGTEPPFDDTTLVVVKAK